MKNSKRRLAPLAGLAAAALFAADASAQPNVDGVWSPISPWPLIAVHAVMTPDGRVLTYGTNSDGRQTGYFIYDVWDPSAGLAGGHLTISNLTLTDIFCSSQIIMPQSGDILIAGGDNWTGTSTTNTGNNNTNIFNPASNTLTRAANLNTERWYSSATVLVNGDIYIQGGNGGGSNPEVRQQDGSFRFLGSADTSAYVATFPHNFLAPDGRVFGYDAAGRMYYIDASGAGSVNAQGQFSSANAGSGSGAAMFAPGKILQFGGNSSGAIVIDINGPQPVVTTTQSMSSQRFWVTGTVLPDGSVLATGGSRVDNELVDVNNSAEIWDPTTGQWHVGTSGATPRLYHSNALLLQDGTVLVAGGGAPGPLIAPNTRLTNTNAEIYSPPYLFNSSGGPAVRPQIVSVPSSADVGSSLNIVVDTNDIDRVTLVKTGSITHSVNMDQRFVEVPFTKSSTLVTASLPARATDIPPGIYHLFVFNSAGVPSRSKLLQINIDPTPNTAVDFTPTIGGSGGSAYTLACAANETLVGAYGRYGTVINQIGPQCVQVDQFGRWIGDPVQRPVTGTTSTGTAFNRVCPRDFAMSGFQGRSGTTVNQVELQCRALTATGGLTGTGTFLGADGGTGGTAQPLQACGTQNPVYALYGRSNTQINSFGVLCRPAVITPVSTGSLPVVVNPGDQTSVTGIAVDLAIQASDSDEDPLTFSASGLPNGLDIDAATGHITGVPTTPGTTQPVVTVSDGTNSSFAVFDWTVTGNALLTVAPMPAQPPRLAATPMTYTASVSGGTNVVYKWHFDDGTPETAYSPSPSVTHSFALPGVYFVTLTVTDDLGIPAIQSFVQHVHLPLTPALARNSASIAYETRSGANSRVWLVNQDNDSVSVFDAVTNAKSAEITVGAAPRSVAIAPDGRIWVVNRDAASISIVSPTTLAVVQTVTLVRASQPYGLVFSPTANQAFVALAATGMLLKLDALTGAEIASVDVGPEPRHIAIDGTGTKIYVARFITPRQPGEETATVAGQVGSVYTGGETVVVDALNLLVNGTVTLRHSDRPDSENQGSGVPNYLGAPAISPDGTVAMVPSKQDNIARGTLRNGLNLNFQNTVRAIASRIDLATGTEDHARRIDFDDSSVASSVAYDPYGVYAFVALETSREVAVVDVHDGVELFRIAVGRAPQGLAVAPDGTRLYVNNFMDRSISVFDLTELTSAGQWNVPQLAVIPSVGTERLSAQVLAGKQLFYDASDPRLARDAYLSCASCHNDGGQDGRVWDLTGMGEGLRNTINLRGPGAQHGRLHWTGNFDEVQDFEGQIRTLAGGTGLMSDAAFNTGTRNQPLGDPKTGISADLDALAAYVASLNGFAPSPNRTTAGTLTPEAIAGRGIFGTSGCASCHSGSPFTNSVTNALTNVGTIKLSSGQRLGAPLTGLDTPTLCSVWQTAPYLHDGSAASIEAAISAHTNVSLTASDVAQVAAYVRQIDAVSTPDCVANVGLIAAYSFDEGAGSALVDRSGNVNTGTIQGTVAWTTQGKNSGALTFNGTSTRVSIPSSTSLNVSAVTLEAWVYPTASQEGWRAILQKEVDAWFLHASHSGGPLWPAAGGTNGAAVGVYTGASSAIPVNAWTHLAQTYDGTTLRLYVNGVQVSSVAQTGALETSSTPLSIGGNSPYGEYFLGRIDDVRVYNRALSVGEIATDMNTPVGGVVPPDTTPPGAPGTLTATAVSATQINLSWGTATDNVGVTGYRVERCVGAGCTTFIEIATPAGTTYNDPGLTASTSYSYRVRANDAVGNLGAFTNTTTEVTPAAADTTPPGAPGTLTATAISATQINLSWGAATDNVGVTGYRVERCAGVGCTTFTQIATPTGTSYSDPGLAASTSYSYRVRANDAAGNLGVFSNTTTEVTPAAADTSPPGAPGTLTASAISATQINLSWGVATDNVGVTGYRVERCEGPGCTTFTQIATPTGTSYSDPGLTASTSYSYRVRANDAVGNLGPFSNTGTATTQAAADTTLPGAPGTLTASAISATQINLSWGAATDNVGVTDYRVERCAGPGCTTFTQVATSAGTSYSDPGLTASTSYSYRVRAADAAGNLGAFSNTSSATTHVATAIPGLVAAYSFDEGAGSALVDRSGNVNTGTIQGTVAWTTLGRNGGALTFNGTSTRVSIPSSTSLNVSAVTLEAWVYPTASQEGWRAILQKEVDAWFLHASHSGGPLWPAAGGTNGAAVGVYTGASSAIPVNAWTHLAQTYDGTTLRLYVNGVQVSSVAQTGALETSSTPLSIGGNSPYGEYFLGRIDDVRVYNRALSVGEIATDMNTPVGGVVPPDTTPPGAPGTLTATAVSATQINLSWGTATDNVGVTGYRVERCVGAGCTTFIEIATPAGTTYNDPGLTASTSYSYRVRANDAVGNLGAFTNTTTEVTPAAADTTPPGAPGTLTATAISATQINLSWGAATDNVGVTGYRVERCAGVGCTTFTQIATPTGTSYSDPGLAASTSYSYRVRANDAAGNLGVFSNTTTEVTPAAADTSPPGAPGTLTASAISATQINLSWGVATDNVGVTGYRVERCEGPGCTTFTQIATPTGTSYSDPGLTASTSYSYRVRANDAVGNLGPFSNTGTATTQAAADTTLPGAPGTLTASAISATQINLSWGAATDNVGVTDYRVERCAGPGCTTFTQVATSAGTSYSDPGLTASTSYSYRVRAADAAGNLGAFSNTSSATTHVATAIPGLVAAYSFDEGAGSALVDRSGNVNTGTIQGTVAWTTLGRNGGALTFNGTSTRVSIPSSTSLNVSAVTLEAWVYPTASQEGWRAILQKEVDAWFLHASHSGGPLWPAAGGTNGAAVGVYTGASSAIPVNAWTHLAQTYDGTTLRLYVNGVQVSSVAQTGALETSSTPLSIGGNSPYGEYFLGRIDDVRVYNRALSVGEIATDMNTPVGP